VKPRQVLCAFMADGNIYIDSAITVASELALAGGDGCEIKRVEVREYKKRSLSANALLHVWINQVAQHTGNSDRYEKAHFKMKFGWPVMQVKDLGRASLIQETMNGINYDLLPFNSQLKFWDLFEVTSVMEVPDLRQAMENYKSWVYEQFGFELTSKVDNG